VVEDFDLQELSGADEVARHLDVGLARRRITAYAVSGITGESQPSEADIKVTRDLIRAGQLLKIEVLDHVIIGRPNHSSLRELGVFLQLTRL
jgi:hypothetical protein